MIDAKLQEAFNDQINKELYSAYLYLAMKTRFMEWNLQGFVNWFDVQVQEEMLTQWVCLTILMKEAEILTSEQ